MNQRINQYTSLTKAGILLAVVVSIFLTGVSAFTTTSDFGVYDGTVLFPPRSSANVSGNITLYSPTNASLNVDNVTFYHNKSGSWTHIFTNSTPQSDATTSNFTVTNHTGTGLNGLNLGDGQLWFIASARNATHIQNTSVRVIVDNTAPSISHAQQIHSNGFGERFQDLDGYYSNASGNNWLALNLSVDSGVTAIRNVTVNMSSMCSGMGSVSAAKLASGNWTASCTVDRTDGYFDKRFINITAWDTAGNKNDSLYHTVYLYNLSYPDTGSGAGFSWDTSRTTNLKTEQNLSGVNYVLAPRFNGTGTNIIPWEGVRTGGVMDMKSLDFTDPAVQNNFSQSFKSAIRLQFVPHGQFRVTRDLGAGFWDNYSSNRIYVNTNSFKALDTATNITLYWLPLYSFDKSFIQPDNSSASVTVFEANSSGAHTNITFQVSGFSGYNISDSKAPIITVDSPANNTITQQLDFNATFNGTGTGIVTNRTYLNIMNVTGGNMGVNLTFNYEDMTCGAADEFFRCNYTPALADGIYNLTIHTGDFGGTNGNNTTIRRRFITVDITPPNGTNDLELTPENESASFLGLSPIVTNSWIGAFRFLGLTWMEKIAGEISDATAGVDHLKLWYRNRSFNTSSQDMDAWTNWSLLNGSINPASVNASQQLSSNYQYQFNLSTVDKANNTNDSNIFNVTLDTSAPVVSTEPDGDNVTSPFNWTNEENVTLSVNLTDLAGINGTNLTTAKTINMTVFNGSAANGSFVLPVSLVPGDDSAAEYQVTADYPVNFLDNLTKYNVELDVMDLLGNNNTFNWTFETDFNDPTGTNFSLFGSYATGKWYRDSVTAEVECADPVSESGPYAVAAAYSNGTIHTGWNTSVPGRLTLRVSGNNTHVFKCRDRAGNVQTNTSDKIAIDVNAPTFSDPEPADGAEVDNVTRNIRVDYSDNGESGVNWTTSNESLREFKIDGDVYKEANGTNWDDDHVTLEDFKVGLENYDVDVTVCDNVATHIGDGAHCTTFSWEFDGVNGNSGSSSSTTQSSSGTTLSQTSSIDVSDVPASVEVAAGGFTTFDVTVENDGDTSQSSIDVSVDVDDAVTVESVSLEDVDLSSGESETFTVNLSAAADASEETYEATVEAESSEGETDSEDLDVSVVVREAALELVGVPSAINVTQGNGSIVSFDVSNTGDADAEFVTFSFAASNFTTAFNKSAANISAGGSFTVDLWVAASSSRAVGVYSGTFIASHSSGDKIASIDIKVQPASGVEQEELENKVAELESRVNSVSAQLNQSDAEELTSLVAEAKTALQRKDYAEAARLSQQIEQQLPPEAESGIPFVPIIIGLLVLTVLAVVAYMFYPGMDGAYPSLDEEGDWRRRQMEYAYEDESLLEQARRRLEELVRNTREKGAAHADRARQQMSRHTDRARRQVQDSFPGRKQSAEDAPRGRDFEESASSSRVTKKRIRFDEE